MANPSSVNYKDMSLAQLVGDLNNLSGGTSDAYQSKVTDLASQYRPIDPGVLQSALRAGGSLSNAAGTETGDFWAMTPENFKSYIDSKVPLTKQITDTTQLADMISGNSATKSALMDAAKMRLSGTQQNVGTGAGMLESQLSRNQSQVQFDASNKIAQGQLGVSQEHLKLGKDTLAFQIDKAKHEQMTLNKMLASQAAQGADLSKSPFHNTDLMLKTQQALTNTVKPGSKLDSIGVENYARAQAYAGSPVGEVINLADINAKSGLMQSPKYKGYPHMILTQSGWYGFNDYIKDKLGNLVPNPVGASKKPIIHMLPPSTSSSVTDKVKASTVGLKYPGLGGE